MTNNEKRSFRVTDGSGKRGKEAERGMGEGFGALKLGYLNFTYNLKQNIFAEDANTEVG